MSSVTVQSRVTNTLKESAAAIFESMGMSTGDAIRMFLQQTVNTGRLPFQPTAKSPNAETIAAMQDVENRHVERADNAQEMFKRLGI
jgi:DNA-damage-inducible protein J